MQPTSCVALAALVLLAASVPGHAFHRGVAAPLRARRATAVRAVQSPSEWPETMADDGAKLLYQDCFRWQEDFLQNELGGRPLPIEAHLEGQWNEQQRARIASRCFETNLFRKVRMTYFDAGHKVQVFNSLWYPRPEFDAPLLGIDLICFSKDKMLTVVDCQPTRPPDADGRSHTCPSFFDEHFAAIRAEHPDLCGEMSNRYYGDEGKHFFSGNMLFGRFGDHGAVQNTVQPAFQQYAAAYADMVGQTLPQRSAADTARVLQQQADYDQYFSHRDPAHGMFTRYFGEAWADEFVYSFLFEGSRPLEEAAAAEAPVPASTSANR